MKILGTAMALVSVIAISGCDDDETSSPMGSGTGGMGGTTSTAGQPATGGSSSGDAGDGIGNAGASGSQGDAGTGMQSLCDKYGGADAVASVVSDYIIAAFAADCRISTHFTELDADTFTHVGECLTIQVQELFGCDGIHYAGAESSVGRECRSMIEAHQGLGISKGDFDALIEDVVTGLTEAGVETADINAAAPALLGMQGAIVEDDTTDNTKIMCTMADAGSDAGDAAP